MSDTLLDDWMVTFAQIRAAERARIIAAVREWAIQEATIIHENWRMRASLGRLLNSLERGEADARKEAERG